MGRTWKIERRPGKGECRVSIFFFQAEDGIRYLTVTGVQTCALPISVSVANHREMTARAPPNVSEPAGHATPRGRAMSHVRTRALPSAIARARSRPTSQIGRASCRERVEISVVAVSLKKKKVVSLEYS